MKLKSNINSIEAWLVNVGSVRDYINNKVWNDCPWVKQLIDDEGETLFGKRGIEYFDEETKEVDFDEYKTYPPRLMLNGGAVCYDGDYIIRFERDTGYVFHQKANKEDIERSYTILEE